MSPSPIINGLMIFFSVTTAVVLLYPVVKLAPLWFERRVQARIALHRDAVAALVGAIDQAGNDHAQRGRLAAQLQWHRAALANLAPGDAMLATAPAIPFDAAA